VARTSLLGLPVSHRESHNLGLLVRRTILNVRPRCAGPRPSDHAVGLWVLEWLLMGFAALARRASDLNPPWCTCSRSVAGLLLFAGFMDAHSGCICSDPLRFGNIFSQPGDPWPNIMVGTLAAALALLGPGCLVGRRSPFWMEANRPSRSKELGLVPSVELSPHILSGNSLDFDMVCAATSKCGLSAEETESTMRTKKKED